MKKKEQQKGQVLLITIMLLATALTVVLSSSFKSTQETQTNKLEEEAQKALSVAEAGIESALQSGSSVDLGEITTGFSGQAKIDQTTSSTFTTPLLQKDEQYTFYLSKYYPQSKTIETTPYSGDITISLVEPKPDTYCKNDNTELAIELTFVNTDGTISKRLINDCGIVSGTTNKWNLNKPYYSPADYPASHLLFLRVIAPDSSFQGAKIKISSSSNWQLQGNTIVSEAQSTTGVTKTVQLFQSYPQIPSEFFVTSF